MKSQNCRKVKYVFNAFITVESEYQTKTQLGLMNLLMKTAKTILNGKNYFLPQTKKLKSFSREEQLLLPIQPRNFGFTEKKNVL